MFAEAGGSEDNGSFSGELAAEEEKNGEREQSTRE
jgi:hypothetical protein